MWLRRNLLLVTLTSFLHASHGCSMEGVTNWVIPQSMEILDVYRGSFFSRSISNIQSISNINYGGGLNRGPYVLPTINSTTFDISTNDDYETYEEYETMQSMTITVTFSCTGGSTSTLVFIINIKDTNNNAPRFLPSDEYSFTIATPVPPGFQITGCNYEIIARDIDLTTQRIDFEIEDNPYFEIAYDADSSTTSKEFKAILRTKVLIRALPDIVELRITGTDVDLTGDDPIITTAIVRIQGDAAFELPTEPIFSQPFYLASYTNSHEIILQELITLQQGYDEYIEFSLEGDLAQTNFQLVENTNELSVAVTNPLSNEQLRARQVLLVVRANREYTSGATATIVVQLPEVLGVEFSQSQYEGSIVDNVLQPLQLVLSRGHEDGVNVNITGEYASYFSYTVQGNIITLLMAALDSDIIDANSFVSLQVIAWNDYSTATAVVTLDIIKDDNNTPLFEKDIYIGTYDPDIGLTHEQIALAQGDYERVIFNLDGEHKDYFEIERGTNNITLTVLSPLPVDIWVEQHVLLTIRADKPRTVGAVTTVLISLPEPRELRFEAPTYDGTLQNNELTLPTIVLSVGYGNDVTFNISGVYSNYFSHLNVGNQVNISLTTAVPSDIITNNNFIMLTLTAIGLHTVPTSTNILIEIIKEDITTPVFNENIYRAVYVVDTDVIIENISLVQGYDSTVTFRLDGEYSEYFTVDTAENMVTILAQSTIPEELIYEQKVLVFNILAEKALTVGAQAAIVIQFAQELTEATIMSFEQKTYIGVLEENNLELQNIVLDTGYRAGTEFLLFGEFSSYFGIVINDNTLAITLNATNSIPPDTLKNTSIVILELEARRDRAVATHTSIILEVKKQDIVPMEFTHVFYKGTYTEAEGLTFETNISLSEGFDETVLFVLDGDLAIWFNLVHQQNVVTLILNSLLPIPEEVLQDNNQLLFTIIAQKPDARNASAAISVELPKEILEPEVLQFSQNYYEGRIENGELEASTMHLLPDNLFATLNLTGEYAEYFGLSRDANIIILQLISELPSTVIEENAFIVLDIIATYPEAISGHTTYVIELVKYPVVRPVFKQTYYTGEYLEESGLLFEHSIQLIEGFDESVSFILYGDDADWFQLVNNGENNVTLILANNTIGIQDRSYLVFEVVANKADSVSGRTAIIITLGDFNSDTSVRFSQNYYLGSVENSNLTLEQIMLEDGYTTDLNISLDGDFNEYFQLTQNGGLFTLQLSSELPADEILDKNVIVLTLEVQSRRSTTHATIILEIVKLAIITPAFNQSYYVGFYSNTRGFIFDGEINLLDDYDETVIVSLEGDQSQWFDFVRNQNSLSLILSQEIPEEVLTGNQQLIFVILAEKLETPAARATIVISIIDELTVQNFDKNSYVGAIENNTITTEFITLTSEAQNVTLNLVGVLSDYFIGVLQEQSVIVSLRNSIPESLIPPNNIIILELQASAPLATNAYTTIVLKYVREDIEQLRFSDAYYTGNYTEAEGLVFGVITLAEGFDEIVRFELEGVNSQWFEQVSSGNEVSLTVSTPIPSEVLLSNQQLIFVIKAEKPGNVDARATIVIGLINEEVDELNVLRFDKLSYLGTYLNNQFETETITLIEGYNENITYSLKGELDEYFDIVDSGPNITIILQNALNDEVIQAYSIIILELLAVAPQSISAHATIIIDVVPQNIVAPVFDAVYYTGQYSDAEGLVFEKDITLIQGYEDSVEFLLEGDNSQWFDLDMRSQNNLTLLNILPIPIDVINDNQQLIFVVKAHKPENTTARATIVISLENELTDTTVLRFEKNTYTGSIENEVIKLETITLNEGYTNEVEFTLTGELDEYFDIVDSGPNVTIILQNPLNDEVIKAYSIIILELLAVAPQSVTAHATIIIEVVPQDIVAPVFDAVYYTGQYSDAEGLVFEKYITLIQGYEDRVEFLLEGDNSQWFDLDIRSQNNLTLLNILPIPIDVINDNQQLIFVVKAHKPENITARATIVISLENELTDTTVLRFEKNTYIGSIEDEVIQLETITLSEGYTDDVEFMLTGELGSYFSFNRNGSGVIITMPTIIPEASIPENRIIILGLNASSPQAISAFTSIVIEVVKQDTSVQQLVFGKTYYTGVYNESQGLIFDDIISMAEGYESTVEFYLEGDNSQWFDIVREDNTVLLVLAVPIPSAVIANNQKIIFVIRADKPNSVTARATIVISLIDEFTRDLILGFEKIAYMGSIENNNINLETIILSEGYTDNVSFNLHGALSIYFNYTNDGPSLTITVPNGIPVNSVPNNGIIILELQAIAPQTMSAYTVIVLEVKQSKEMVFNQVYYVGNYNETIGLSFDTPISLYDGYDETVQFSLGAGLTEWFSLEVTGNSAIVISVTPLPSDVLANNSFLKDFVTANRPNGESASAAVIILLETDPVTEDGVSFERILYEGSIEEGIVQHETILVFGYNGTDVQIIGEYSHLFDASIVDGTVTVKGADLVTLPSDISSVALELRVSSASAVLILEIIHSDQPIEDDVRFTKTLYEGVIENGEVEHESIVISNYTGTTIQLRGQYETLFDPVLSEGIVTIRGVGLENLPSNVTFVALEMSVGNASAVLVLTVNRDDPNENNVSFTKTLYEGVIEDDEVQHEAIIVSGYEGTNIELRGQHETLFEPVLSEGIVTIRGVRLENLPSDVTFVALEMRVGDASAVLVLNVMRNTTGNNVSFSKAFYEGVIEDGDVQHEAIVISGYEGTDIELIGQYDALFEASLSEGLVTIRGVALENLPSDITFVALKMRVSGATAVLVLTVKNQDNPSEHEVRFTKTLYEGTIQNGEVQHESIVVSGYNGTNIELSGQNEIMFDASVSEGIVTVRGVGLENLPYETTFVALEMIVGDATAVLVLTVVRNATENDISFTKALYEGVIEDGDVQHEAIVISGYEGTNIELIGQYDALFEATLSEGLVTIRGIALENLPSDISFVALKMRASGASAVLVLTVKKTDNPSEGEVRFTKTLYEGTIQNDEVQHEFIVVSGYNGTNIELSGQNDVLFDAAVSEGTVTVRGVGLENLPYETTFVALEMTVGDATAVLVLTVVRNVPIENDVRFTRTLYQGIIQGGVVQHESIEILGYNGTNIQLIGHYAPLFDGTVIEGTVIIRGLALENLPSEVTFVPLEIRVSGANAIIVLTVNDSESPVMPTVTFSSPSYVLRIEITQTGLVGRVLATADNDEAVTYSLDLADAHLQQRLSIDNAGGLLLSATANSGVYSFQVEATTVFTRASATAQIFLTVEAITVCGEDDLVVPPLIILDRDEEEPHRNLVLLNTTLYPNCQYRLTNQWPIDQTWLYVDENGLHTFAIDREDESIAFMALSQVQVELILECDSDNAVRTKRSLNSESRLNHLGPYDYGSKKWILSDTILYNSRRSLVNLIVNDINDNDPIFVGKENEPIAIGYPLPDIEERVLPRALIELKATDADIGDNARLVYWSSNDILAVAPTTGLVHVRKNLQLEDNMLLTVSATDRNGASDGRTGTIRLMVKLVDTSHIAVITIQSAFLDDEIEILADLSSELGYEVKALRSTVISNSTFIEEPSNANNRRKRDVATNAGASLQLYVYGLIEREPVEVDRLTKDISNLAVTTVNIVSTISLEDHLDNLDSCATHSATGLLVSTIVLAVLLFVLIVAAAVWYFLTRRKEKYEQFSDENSLASRKVSDTQLSLPETLAKPRLNIEELKKSERRLQEMLDAPMQEVTVEPSTSRTIPPPEPINLLDTPVVIQSIDKLKDADGSEDEDEFGERAKTKRKSVVTFNENVEKIIHVEDRPDNDSLDKFEVYKF